MFPHARGMKLITLALLFICTLSFAGTTPFGDQLEAALNFNGGALGQSSEAVGLQRVARVMYNVAVEGGTSSATIKNLGVSLPKNSVVTKVDGYVDGAFINSGTLRVSLMCGSKDLDNQRNMNIQGTGSMFTNTTGLPADCGTSSAALGARITDATPTVGQVTYMIQYFIHN